MRRSVLEALNAAAAARGEARLMNTRNAAVGALRQRKAERAAERPLSIVLYGVGESFDRFRLHSQLLAWLRIQGFSVGMENTRALNVEEALAARAALEGRRDTLDFDMDGVVFKLEDRDLYAAAGGTGRWPGWRRAFKSEVARTRTVLEGIEVEVGRTGAVTPVAVLTPVELDGSLISRASLHNAAFIAGLDLRPGDTVEVRKAGSVIPEITANVSVGQEGREAPFVFPEVCPACGSRLVQGETADGEEEATVRCAHRTCTGVRFRSVLYFAERGNMDVQGLGEETLRALMNAGLVRSVADLYRLTEADFVSLPGVGARSALQITDCP